MGDLGTLAKFLITRLCRDFWNRLLRRNVFRCLHFKCILMKISWHLRRTVLRAPKVGLRFGGFPLVPPLQNFRKWAIMICSLVSSQRAKIGQHFEAKSSSKSTRKAELWEIAHFLGFCQGGPRENEPKRRPTLGSWKTTRRIGEHSGANSGSNSARKTELWKI